MVAPTYGGNGMVAMRVVPLVEGNVAVPLISSDSNEGVTKMATRDCRECSGNGWVENVRIDF